MANTPEGDTKSGFKRSWTQWDNAWDLNVSRETRLRFLKEAVAPSFVYCNSDHRVDGDLERLAQLIEEMLQAAGNNIVVKHIKWWEHHDQSALQWNMVHVESGDRLVSGVSWAKYDSSGRLLAVTDFF